MASNSFVVNERETLEEIKSEMKDIAEDVKIEEPEHPAAVDKAIFMLNKMLKNIEKDLNDLDTKIGTSKKYLDHDDDGYIHKQELVYALIDDLKATNSEEEVWLFPLCISCDRLVPLLIRWIMIRMVKSPFRMYVLLPLPDWIVGIHFEQVIHKGWAPSYYGRNSRRRRRESQVVYFFCKTHCFCYKDKDTQDQMKSKAKA